MQHGIKPTPQDERDYSFHRTFGTVSQIFFPEEFDCDAGLGFPDQNAEGFPYACSGYTQAELCQDEDGTKYNPIFTYHKTQSMEGTLGQQVGCDLRDSLKSTIVYGVQAPNETTDEQAGLHRRGNYFRVADDPHLDAFDDIRNALFINKYSVSIGTPWFMEWAVPIKGVVQDFTYDGNPNNYSWHNWKICGWKTINGQPYLLGKTWQGAGYGDGGMAYFSRDIINKVLKINGTAAFTLARATPGDIQTIRITIIEQILIYCRRLLLILQHA